LRRGGLGCRAYSRQYQTEICCPRCGHSPRGSRPHRASDRAIDEGWREHWWYLLHHKPDLEPIHDEPEFQAMLAEIRADMAAQLERVREMERRGELALAAELPTPTTPRSE
jgi:hypothetical protein